MRKVHDSMKLAIGIFVALAILGLIYSLAVAP